ncbi:hypothetical protein [Nocardia testacea]|uniref:hypothetical protein n=1 Tax=Nocardia testacea TaxID=248551 RepID=UPI0033C9CD85
MTTTTHDNQQLEGPAFPIYGWQITPVPQRRGLSPSTVAGLVAVSAAAAFGAGFTLGWRAL